jgi:FkbM family methyltransferase
MGNFFRTISSFSSNNFVDKRAAIWRHSLWQIRKIFNLFPHDIPVGNFKVRVANKAVANGVGAMVNALGYFDPNNMHFLEELYQAKKCTNFYDVGANIGFYSLLVASSMPEAQICAFEPHPGTFSMLKENLLLNGLETRIRCWQTALGRIDGKVNFIDNPGSPINTVLPEDITDQAAKTIRVDIRRGETFFRETGISPEVLKIDVEGFENEVLVGFAECLPSVKLILSECQNVAQTKDFLCGEFGFNGPYKMDFKARRLMNEPGFSNEDWLFLSREFIADLAKSGFDCRIAQTTRPEQA